MSNETVKNIPRYVNDMVLLATDKEVGTYSLGKNKNIKYNLKDFTVIGEVVETAQTYKYLGS